MTMSDRIQASPAHAPGARSAGLSPEQLAGEQAHDLPDREAMSILNVGELSGPFPVPAGLEPAVPVDPSIPIPAPIGIPSDVDLTNVEGGGGISDVTDVSDVLRDVTPLVSPGELTDVQESADVTGASVDGSSPADPAGLMQPSPSGLSTLA